MKKLFMIKSKIFRLYNKRFLLLIIAALLLLISFTLFTGCTGLPKYTYEEYKKIKAFNENKGTETAKDDTGSNNENLSDLEMFYKDLDSYNNFITDFNVIYNKYSDLLLPLFDSFDNEQEDLDKKNQCAESIMLHQNNWLEEIKEMDIPDIMTTYHDYFQKYLEKEVIFYESFLNGDEELLEKYQLEANEMYENMEEELQRIEKSFNTREAELGVEQPFEQ